VCCAREIDLGRERAAAAHRGRRDTVPSPLVDAKVWRCPGRAAPPAASCCVCGCRSALGLEDQRVFGLAERVLGSSADLDRACLLVVLRRRGYCRYSCPAGRSGRHRRATGHMRRARLRYPTYTRSPDGEHPARDPGTNSAFASPMWAFAETSLCSAGTDSRPSFHAA